MTILLYSPAEPASVVRLLGREAGALGIDIEPSNRTEHMGVDFAWRAQGRWWGVQRKELHDFLASLDDGRLNKEVAQMRAAITMPMLVLEGRIQVTNGQVMTNGFGRPVTLSGLHKRLLTLQSNDILVTQVSELAQTVSYVLSHYEWSAAEGHATAGTRPKPAGDWGRPSNRDYQVHLLTSLPGVGHKTAASILDTLGRCPLRMDTTVKELVTVPGVGPLMARRMLTAINGTSGEQ